MTKYYILPISANEQIPCQQDARTAEYLRIVLYLLFFFFLNGKYCCENLIPQHAFYKNEIHYCENHISTCEVFFFPQIIASDFIFLQAQQAHTRKFEYLSTKSFPRGCGLKGANQFDFLSLVTKMVQCHCLYFFFPFLQRDRL